MGDNSSVVEFVPSLNRVKLVTRLRELEKLNASIAQKEGRADHLCGVIQGWSEAFGEVADWIELGEFDNRSISK